MQHYVNGFLFSPDRQRVALIRKRQPAWQAGRMNGIGGKVEPGETSLEAMVREFEEEAGVSTLPDDWQHFVTLSGEGFVIRFYRAFSDRIDDVRTVEAEEVSVHPVDTLPERVLHNLRWLIPMALDAKLDLQNPVQVLEA